MTYEEFRVKYDGKGVDFDGYYGFQCMDLYRQYCKECLEVPQSPPVNGAKDVWDNFLVEYFDRFLNEPTAIPQKGDIMIWSTGVGPYGHIAIFDNGDVNSFTSFDQNWPVGSLCHLQAHNYTNVLGWLRKKGENVIISPVFTDQTKISKALLGTDEDLEIQQIRGLLNDLKLAKDEIIGLRASLTALNDRISLLEQQIANPLPNTSEGTLRAIHDVLYSSGFWWTKLSKIKALLPK